VRNQKRFVLRLAIPGGTRLKQGFRTDHLYWDTVANLKRVLEADAEAECSNWTPEEGEILREMLQAGSTAVKKFGVSGALASCSV